MIEVVHVKTALRGILFTTLLIVYSSMYMEPALRQYGKKDKTIAQKRENIAQPESPVLVLCPDPPFKASFFEQFGEKKIIGAENFFWVVSPQWQMVANHPSTALDIYTNMSYQLGTDWNISLVSYLGSFQRYAFLTFYVHTYYYIHTYFIFKFVSDSCLVTKRQRVSQETSP